jgi:two-component system response regulator RegA
MRDEPRRRPVTRRPNARGGRRDTDEGVPPERAGDRPTVVLVDDDAATLDGLSEWLANEGFSVVACSTFAEARAQIMCPPIAALITDIRLEEYNGLHLVQLARSLQPHARLVVFSGFADPVLEAEAEMAGAIWLLKPIHFEQLGEHLAGLSPAPGSESKAGEPR